jgi:vacuolar-type H+-ATPase subunit F/Vma7
MSPAAPPIASRVAGRVAVLGERSRVQGYALAGAVVLAADDPAAVRASWEALPADIAVAILTARAARALTDATEHAGWPLVVVMPE